MKKLPQRKCVGCGVSTNKSEMIRVVRSPEGEISVDLKGKKSGRGAYICKDEECLKKALKARKFERSLDIKISDSEEFAENLLSQIRENEDKLK
jgi:predicted RNA-binding protein YlxR (DUF448 family)